MSAPVDDGAWGLPAAWLGGGLVVAAVASLAWLASDVQTAPAPAASTASALQEAVRLPAVWAMSASHAVAAPPAVAVIAAAAASSVGVPPGHVEVCGLGVVKESELLSQPRVEAMTRDADATRRRVAAALIAAADEPARALGLALDATGGDRVFDEDVPCEGGDCPAPPWRTESPEAQVRRLAGQSRPRDQLLRLALTTRSPAVYQLALSVCRDRRVGEAHPTCGMLSEEQWARLDPDNSVPWLHVAEAARTRADAAGVSEAVYRASQARRVENHQGHFARLLLERMPAGVSELEAVQLAVEAQALLSSPPPYTAVLNECSADAVRDANRAQRCEALATTLWDRGDLLLDKVIGLAIGGRAGWSPDTVQARRDERDALGQAGRSASPGASLSCADLQRTRQWLAGIGRAGEVAAAHGVIKASGKPVAEWARQARAERATAAARQVQAAAEAASGMGAAPTATR